MATLEEKWKDVPYYEGVYKISSLGNVKELKDGKWVAKLKHTNRTTGYVSIILKKSGPLKAKTAYIHRLVALAFLDNKDNKREVNHIDGNKSNNSLQNLEWVTSSENKVHAIKTGLLPMHTPKQQMSRSDTGKKTWLKNFKIDREGISEGTRVTRSPIRVTEGDKVVIYRSISEASRINKHERHFYIRRLNNPDMDNNIKVEYVK